MNAASGVLGSVLAILLALNFGFDATLGCAAGTYLAAAVLTLLWQGLPERRKHFRVCFGQQRYRSAFFYFLKPIELEVLKQSGLRLN
jgi:hypothetical protein